MADVALKRLSSRAPSEDAPRGVRAVHRLVATPAPIPLRELLPTLDDSAVVELFLTGEERAFQALVDRYQVRLLNFVYRTLGDRGGGEDPVEEWVCRVFHHRH